MFFLYPFDQTKLSFVKTFEFFVEMALIRPDKPWFLTLFTVIATVQIFLTSGLIFGYSSILAVFKRMKFYHSLCDTNATLPLNKSIEVSELQTCNERDRALNLLFVVGLMLHTFFKFPLGVLVDRVGAQICQILAWYVLFYLLVI